MNTNTLERTIISTVREYLADKDAMWDLTSDAVDRVLKKKDIKAILDATVHKEVAKLLSDPNLVKKLAIKQLLNRRC